MAIIGTLATWCVWATGCVAFLMFAKDVFDTRRIVRLATRMICVLLLPALVVTAATDVATYHLLWFIPLVFFICRSLAASIVLNDAQRRVRDRLVRMEKGVEAPRSTRP